MSALEVFDYAGIEVRTVLVDGEPWFVAADVAAILEMGNVHSSLALLDDDEKGLHSVETRGGTQNVGTINEPGLYSLILRSRKPEAKSFKRWVTHEVLPSIRRTGQFGSRVPASFAEALELAAVKQREIEAAEAKIAADAPKVEAYDRLMDADGYYPMDEVAKIVGLGRTTLYSRLRSLGIIMRGSTTPYQRHMHHFILTASTFVDGNGIERSRSTTRLRPSGLPFIMRQLGIEERVA